MFSETIGWVAPLEANLHTSDGGGQVCVALNRIILCWHVVQDILFANPGRELGRYRQFQAFMRLCDGRRSFECVASIAGQWRTRGRLLHWGRVRLQRDDLGTVVAIVTPARAARRADRLIHFASPHADSL